MAKFLKEHVELIGGNITDKPVFYPNVKLHINKYFVNFFDDHELILDISQSDKVFIYFSYGITEYELKPNEFELARNFFYQLFRFGFLQDFEFRGRSITDRIRGSDPRDAGSIPAVPTNKD